MLACVLKEMIARFLFLFLFLIEFIYNDSFHFNIRLTPYGALIGDDV